jgi:hypothetical protein
MGTMEYIRKAYNVPAKRGGRVCVDWYGIPYLGRITSATVGGRLRVRIDGERRPCIFHPTHKIEYLAP